MGSKVVIDCKGLVLAPGELSRSPGSLIQADNVNVEAPGIIRSRNGFAKQTYPFGGPIWKMFSTKELGSNILMTYGSATSSSGLKYGDGTGAASTIAGTFTNATASSRMQAAVGNHNHYLTVDSGVARIESDYTAWHAGMPKGLALDQTGPTCLLVQPLNYYDSGSNGVFTVGLTITGATSSKTAVIRAKGGATTVGVLYVQTPSGAFTQTEQITDTSTGKAWVTDAPPGVRQGFLSDGASCAYRVTWCKYDANKTLLEGAPTGRSVVHNNTRTTGWATGEAKDVICRVLIPRHVGTASTPLTTAYFYRLYRSRAVTDGDVDAQTGVVIVPDDEMCLVAEGYLAAGDITLGYVDVVDTAPEGYRTLGPKLYTSVGIGGDSGLGGPGIIQSNNPPPRARDVALYAGCMFYGDLHYLYGKAITLLSVVPSIGLTVGDTLLIGGVTYTAVASGSTPADNQFRVITSTGPTDGTNSEAIERTATNIIEAVNKSTTNATIWAYSTSSNDGLPGGIYFESRLDATAFALYAASHATAFRPAMSSGGSNIDASADILPNGWAFSKPNQPDAVPPLNFGTVGRSDTNLLKMVVLGDALFLFSDSGLYRLTGRSASDFAIQEFDLSFRLIGREMVTVCDDAIYAWGIEGVARITSGGVEHISNAIEPYIQQIVSDVGLTWMAGYSWSCAFRSRHKVMFSVPGSSSMGNSTAILVYDTRMQSWTRWTFAAGSDTERTQGHSCGVVRYSDDLLFMGQWNSISGDTYPFKERRSYAATDYRDDTYTASNQVITKTVKFSAQVGSPEQSTHWDELHLLFDVSPTFTAWTTPTALTAAFTSDFASSSSSNTVSPTTASRSSRALVPQAQRRSARLTVTITHATAEYFGLEGIALVHLDPEGTATVRT